MLTQQKKLNVLYVLPAYKPAYKFGGPIVSISAVAERLASRGHNVTVLTTNSDGSHELDIPLNQRVIVNDVKVYYYRRIEIIQRILPFIDYLSQSVGYRYAPDLSKSLKHWIKSCDLVHVQAVWAYPTLVAGKAAIRARKPLFFHQRGEFHSRRLSYRRLKKRIYLEVFLRPIIDRATMLIALNKKEVEYYRALGFDQLCRIIPNGVDTTKYYHEPVDKNFGEIVIKTEHKVILFMSRMHTFKGADIQIDSFIKIARKFSNAVLVMAGPDEQGLTNDLQEKVSKAGLNHRVFFPGMVLGSLKKNLLARADLFCLPSIGEGFSIAVLEAMASATPVLITPDCNFPDVSIHNAGKVEVRDKWCQALSSLISNPSRLSKMGNNAFKLVKQSYTWDKIVEKMEDAYFYGTNYL